MASDGLEGKKKSVLKRKVFMDLLNMCRTAGHIQSIAVTECYCRYCSSPLIYHSHAGLKESSFLIKSVMSEMSQGFFCVYIFYMFFENGLTKHLHHIVTGHPLCPLNNEKEEESRPPSLPILLLSFCYSYPFIPSQRFLDM